jgi:UrcA family protein
MTSAFKWISTLAVATAVSVASFSSGAAELTDDDAPTQTVRAWDLDLTKPEDVQTLYRRVQDAANDICRAETLTHWRSTRRWPVPSGWTERCIADAVDAAVRDVANPLLAALHTRMDVARND